jgi:polyisoprenoid-binding protein YceI
MPSLRRWLPRRPRTPRGWILSILGAAVAILAAGFAVIYFVVFGTSSPPPLTLATPPPTGTTSPIAAGQIPGTWTVGTGSVAGYRVREKLASVPAPSEAVGRTNSVRGTATLIDSGGALMVTAASFTVDVNTLTSDRSMRDQRIHSIGLQSDRFPTAIFVLSSPISVPAAALTGEVVHLPALGQLTLHGASKAVTIPLDARLSGGEIEVVGAITFSWSDFGMQAPNVGGFVSVADQATMELDIHLRHG